MHATSFPTTTMTVQSHLFKVGDRLASPILPFAFTVTNVLWTSSTGISYTLNFADGRLHGTYSEKGDVELYTLVPEGVFVCERSSLKPPALRTASNWSTATEAVAVTILNRLSRSEWAEFVKGNGLPSRK